MFYVRDNQAFATALDESDGKDGGEEFVRVAPRRLRALPPRPDDDRIPSLPAQQIEDAEDGGMPAMCGLQCSPTMLLDQCNNPVDRA